MGTQVGVAGHNAVLRVGSNEAGRSRDVTLNTDATEIDVTTRDSGGWREFIQGLRAWTIDNEELWVPDNEALTALRNAFLNGTVVVISFEDDNGNKFEGCAILTAMGIPQPLDDALMVNYTLRGTGALTYTGAAS